jgi:hypothetical protein
MKEMEKEQRNILRTSTGRLSWWAGPEALTGLMWLCFYEEVSLGEHVSVLELLSQSECQSLDDKYVSH